MLKLIDLIRRSGVDLGHYKIHCATDNKRSEWRPLEQYYCGTFELGQSQQAQKNFECDHVVSLINLSNSRRRRLRRSWSQARQGLGRLRL
jgi:hypothetical protein